MMTWLIMLMLTFFIVDWVSLILVLSLGSLMWFMMNSSYDLGLVSWVIVDNLSFILIVLSFWITMLMLLTSTSVLEKNQNWSFFVFLCLLMLCFLFLSFSHSNLLFFYIMFEASLIPIFLLVSGWGYQPERLPASYYLLFYTLAASLPLLLGLFSMESNTGTLDYPIMNNLVSNSYLLLIMAFLVKMPVYLFHLWLPKAHVEAPVAGSMMLAGVLLKLGGYGLYRLFMILLINVQYYSNFIMVLALIGGGLASLICLCQTDAKSLVAYSSVAHMALVLVGLLSMTAIGWMGAVLIMVAHGLCSSGLFVLVGLSYNRYGTRSILLMRGSMMIAPLLCLWWFLFSIFNMAAPPSLNLIGEIFIFISMFNWMSYAILFVGLISFLSAGYSLFLYSFTQHGSVSNLGGFFLDGDSKEHLILYTHFIYLMLGVFYFY